MLHGLTATTAEVRPLAKRLLSEGYTVSGILLPGHGTTPENLSQTHREDWIKASEEAYNELKQECLSVIVGGVSVGALKVAHEMMLGCRYLGSHSADIFAQLPVLHPLNRKYPVL